MEIVSINKAAQKAEQHKKDLLEILDKFKEMIENDEIDEFVIASTDKDGEVQIHVTVRDLIGGVGLFEIGKKILIDQEVF